MSDLVVAETIEEKKKKKSAFMKKKARKKAVRACFSALAWIICAILLFLCANNIYQQVINKDNYVGFFNIGNAVVESGSMQPTFYADDMIIYKKANLETLKEGDIVVYKRGDDLIVHRIVSIADGYVTTKGDNNSVADEPFEKNNVIGVYIKHFSNIGVVVKFLASPIATFALLGLIVLITFIRLAFYFRNRKKLLRSISDNIESQNAIVSFFDL